MKSKKSLFVVSGIVLLVIIVSGILIATFISKSNQESKKDTQITESTYTAYVSINPLIKLTFKVSCQNDVCGEPTITDYELSNDDAKIYEDLDIKDKTLEETIELLGNAAKENNYTFSTITVYSNWTETETYLEEEKQGWNIDVTIKSEKEIETIIEENEKDPIITKTIGIPIDDRNLTEGYGAYVMGLGPNCYEENIRYYYGEGGPYAADIYIKVNIQGKQSLLENATSLISAYLDYTGLTTGDYQLNVKVESKDTNIEILPYDETPWLKISIQ